MKKLLLVFVLACGFMTAQAQNQAVKLGPLGFLFGQYNLAYEKAINEKASLQGGASVFSYELFDNKTLGIGLNGAYRYYFKNAIKGPYVSGRVGLNYNRVELSAGGQDETGNFLGLNAGPILGWQFITGGNFVFDLGVGYGYRLALAKSDNYSRDVNGGTPIVVLAIGYAFGN